MKIRMVDTMDVWASVGETAGQIYEAFKDEGKPVTLGKIEKTVKKDKQIICLAIGWLLREGKVVVQRTPKTLKIQVFN